MDTNTIQSLRGGQDSILTEALSKMDGDEGESNDLTPATVIDSQPESESVVNSEAKPESEEVFKSPFEKDKPEVTEKPKESADPDFDSETDSQIEEMNNAPHPGEAFRRVRGELKDTKSQLAELSEKIKAYESGDIQGGAQFEEMRAKIDRYDELIKENESLSQKIATVDYRETSEYKNQILKPYDGIASLAASLEKKSDLPEGDIMKAITSKNYSDQNAAIDAIRDKVDDRTYNSIIRMADDMSILYQKDDDLSKNAEKLMIESRSSRDAIEAKDRQKQEEVYKRSVNSVFEEYQDKIPLFLADDGTESPLSKNLKDQASAISFESMSADQKAFAAMSALSLAPMMRKYNEMSKKLAALSANKRAEDSSSPSGVDTSLPHQASSVGSIKEGETPAEAIARIMGN